MKTFICLLPSAIQELYIRATTRRSITLADYHDLLSVLETNVLTAEEKVEVNRLVYAVRRGWIRVLPNVVPSDYASNRYMLSSEDQSYFQPFDLEK